MNSTSTNYFKNLLIRKKKLLFLYTLVLFVGFPFVLIVNLDRGLLSIAEGCFVICLGVMAILATVLPIFTFKFSLTKRHVDTYYALPINREHLFKAHFFAPIVGALLPILINFAIGAVILTFDVSLLKIFQMFLFLLLAFLLFVAVYSINTFFVLRCNSVVDACIITAAVTLCCVFVSGAIETFIQSQIVPNNMIQMEQYPEIALKLLTPMNGFFNLGETMIESHTTWNRFTGFEWGYYVYYLFVGAMAYFGAQKTFKKKKGEGAEQLSEDIFTYPLFVNLIMICLMLMLNLARTDLTGAIFIVISLFVLNFIGNGIAHRSMKVSWPMVIRFVILITVINLFNFASKETEFFGINRFVMDYREFDRIEIRNWNYSADPGYEYGVSFVPEEASENEKALMDLVYDLQRITSLDYKNDEFSIFEGDIYISISYYKDIKVYKTVNYYLNEQEASEFQNQMKRCESFLEEIYE